MASLLVFAVIFGAIALLSQDVSARIPAFAIATVVVSAIVAGAVVSRTVSDGKVYLALLQSLLAALIFMLIGAIVGEGALPFSVFLNFMIFTGAFTLSAYIFRKRDKFNGKFMRR
jgi:fructose-specific phosphotransferase system IIC component